jgi:hypothetical protein
LLRLRLLHVMRRMTTHVGAPRQPLGHLPQAIWPCAPPAIRLAAMPPSPYPSTNASTPPDRHRALSSAIRPSSQPAADHQPPAFSPPMRIQPPLPPCQVDAMLSADELPYVDLDDAAAGLCDRGDISNEQHRRLMAAAAPLYMQFVDKVRRAALCRHVASAAPGI